MIYFNDHIMQPIIFGLPVIPTLLVTCQWRTRILPSELTSFEIWSLSQSFSHNIKTRLAIIMAAVLDVIRTNTSNLHITFH